MTAYRLYAGGYEGKIVQLEFDPSQPTNRRLRIVKAFACGDAPTWLTFSPDGHSMWSADEWGKDEGTLTSLRIAQDGALEVLSTISTGGLWPCHSSLLTQTDPPQLVTTNYKGANVHCAPVKPNGELDASACKSLAVLGTGSPLGPIAWRQEQAHPHGAHPDPTGTVVVVPDLGTDDLRILHVETASGTVAPGEIVHLQPGDGPRHVLFGPLRSGSNGSREAALYVMNELDNSLSVLRVAYPPRDSPSPIPTFTPVQSRISLLPARSFAHQSSFESWHAAELVLSPCGRFLVASNRAEGHDPLAGTREGPADLLAIFAVNNGDGTLDETSRRLVSSGGRAPRHMSFSSESILRPSRGNGEEPAYLAVALHDSNEVVIFDFSSKGDLTEVARLDNVGRPGIVLWA
ncbi:hypothetical protein JCM3774_004691 [Rhodotorula dairenensis]